MIAIYEVKLNAADRFFKQLDKSNFRIEIHRKYMQAKKNISEGSKPNSYFR